MTTPIIALLLLDEDRLTFLGSVLPPYLTLSVFHLSVNKCLAQRGLENIGDTHRWLCAGGKQTATCDYVMIFVSCKFVDVVG